jgi:tetratricopeptide (TPR) repeat protein
MHAVRLHVLCWCLALMAGSGLAAPLTRAQALAALTQADAGARLSAVERLAAVGSAADAQRVLERLKDVDPRVREASAAAVWQLWGRSGDRRIDELYARGVGQMHAGALAPALATFDEIIRRRPAFAEGWNKRATVLFLLGENEKSLRDCDEVLRRNPGHFGALSGAGQIHLRLGNARRALEFFRRALEVNPTLEGMAELIPLLEQRARDEDKSRT